MSETFTIQNSHRSRNGMSSKFMPPQPTIKEIGKKMVAMMVSVLVTSFKRFDCTDRYVSSALPNKSRPVSINS